MRNSFPAIILLSTLIFAGFYPFRLSANKNVDNKAFVDEEFNFSISYPDLFLVEQHLSDSFRRENTKLLKDIHFLSEDDLFTYSVTVFENDERLELRNWINRYNPNKNDQGKESNFGDIDGILFELNSYGSPSPNFYFARNEKVYVISGISFTTDFLEFIKSFSSDKDTFSFLDAFGGSILNKVHAFGPYTLPFYSNFSISCAFGCYSNHSGTDYSLTNQSPVAAADSGSVQNYFFPGPSNYGNVVVINHAGGHSSGYAHLSSSIIPNGTSILQGQLVGYSGNSGGPWCQQYNSSGGCINYASPYHLHFETRTGVFGGNFLSGTAVDPYTLPASSSSYLWTTSPLSLAISPPSLPPPFTPVSAGTITQNTTWTSGNTYVIQGYVSVAAGVTLTIEPGTIVKFGSATSTIFVNGTLNTPSLAVDELPPVYFTSIHDDLIGGDTNNNGNTTIPQAGDYMGIQFSQGSFGNLDNIVMRYGGYLYPPLCGYPCPYTLSAIRNMGGVLYISNSQIYNNRVGLGQTTGTTTIVTSAIFNNETGVKGRGSSGGVTNVSLDGNNIFNNTDYGIRMSSFFSGPVNLTLLNSSFSNNGIRDGIIPGFGNFVNSGNISSGDGPNGFEIGGQLFQDQVLNPGVPFVVSSLSVSQGTTLTIQEGTVLKFPNTSSEIYVSGTLVAQGTISNKIYFTSIHDDSVGGDTNGNATSTLPSAQDFKGIEFGQGANGVFDNAVLQYGGFSNCGVWSGCVNPRGILTNSGGELSVANTRLRNNYYGIYHELGTSTTSWSSIHDNSYYGVFNATSTFSSVNATNNWWGDASGPLHPLLNPTGTGNPVSDNVNFSPWLTSDPN